MTCRVQRQQHLLTLRDSEGAFLAQGLSSGINKLRNCIYFRFGNRRTLFVRGIKTKPCCAERLRSQLSWCGLRANGFFFHQYLRQTRTQSSTLLTIVSLSGCHATRTDIGVLLWASLPSRVKFFSCAMDAVYGLTVARSTPTSGKENLYFSKCHVEGDPLGLRPITALDAVVQFRSV